MAKHLIDDALRTAKELHPDLYQRTEDVARIIDPGSFGTPWTCSDPDAQRLMDARRKLLQANAMATAQRILEYLGVNTNVDWLEILTRMAKGQDSE